MKRSLLILLTLLLTITAKGQYQEIPLQFRNYPFDFRNLEEFSASMDPSDSLKPFFQDNKFHYLNTHSKKVLSQQFDVAYPYYKQYAVVKQNGKYGIINRNGEFVVQPIYWDFLIDDNEITLEMVNISRQQDISKQFDMLSGKLTDYIFSENVPMFGNDHAYKEGKKYGVIFDKGATIQPIFDTVISINNDFAIGKRSGKYGAINSLGMVEIPFVYENVFYLFTPYCAFKNGNEWSYFKNLKLLFSTKMQPTDLTKNKLIFKKGNYYNYFDETGRVMLTADYNWISDNSCIAINKHNQLVFLDNNKEFVYYTYPSK